MILPADRAAAIILPYHWTAGRRAFPLASALGERPVLQERTARGWREVERLPLHVFAHWTAWCDDKAEIPRATQPGDDFPNAGTAAARSAEAACLIAGFAAGDVAEVALEPGERPQQVLVLLERAARVRGLTLEVRRSGRC
ncbi:MAG: hypothetical protein OHK0022_44880 [Roseiflexaceae bacterium]